MWCFHHFDFEMCFLHNGVHFYHIRTSKSGPTMLCFYPLLRATTVRAFNTSEPPKVFNTFDFEMWRALCHLSSPQTAPRPPLQRAYFSALRRHKSLENIVFRNFSIFSRACIFFPLTLSLLCSSFFFFFFSLLFSSLL